MWSSGEKSPAMESSLPERQKENIAGGASAKRIAANRRNARRSTGPRTPEGKEVSKFNATKHGLRASEIVIPGYEDPEEFEGLYQELCDDWMPEGRTEISLIAEIAIAQWRLRRARRAEFGEIRKGMVDAARDRADDMPDERALILDPEILTKSTSGIHHLKFAVEVAMRELRAQDTISKKTCDKLDRMFGRAQENPVAMLRIWLLDQRPDLSVREELFPDKKAAARAS